MTNIKLPLNDTQKLTIPGIVKKVNSAGGFLTASVLDENLRASSPFQEDLNLLKEEIKKII